MEAVRFYLRVNEDGTIDVPDLKNFKGKNIEVVIIAAEDSEEDLLKASQTSTDFWDNPIDDEVWNGL